MSAGEKQSHADGDQKGEHLTRFQLIHWSQLKPQSDQEEDRLRNTQSQCDWKK